MTLGINNSDTGLMLTELIETAQTMHHYGAFQHWLQKYSPVDMKQVFQEAFHVLSSSKEMYANF
jgi:hypothetical protein